MANKELKEWNNLKKEIKDLHPLRKIRILEEFLEKLEEKDLKKEVEEELEKTHKSISEKELTPISEPKFKELTPIREEIIKEVNLEDNVQEEASKKEIKKDEEFKELYKSAQTFTGYTALESLYGDLTELRKGFQSGYKMSGSALTEVEERLDGLREKITTTPQGKQTFNRVKSFLDEIKMYKEGFGEEDNGEYITKRDQREVW